MPFKPSNLYISRGAYNQSVGPDNAGLHTYASDDDLFSDILGVGYFPPYFGVSSDRVRISDLIFIKDSTDNYLSYRIVEVSPVSLVQDNVSGNPFDQSLNTTSLVTFIGETLTPQVSNPGDATTLWISSLDGHVYRGSVDLESVAGIVFGPVSGTDNAIVRWDGTAGTLVQNSLALVEDNGSASFRESINLDADVYWDNENASPGNVVFNFDTDDYLIFNKASNRFSYYTSATEKFACLDTGEVQALFGYDTLGASPLELGAVNATLVSVNPPMIADTISATLFTDSSLSGGGVTPAQINNSGEIERGIALKTISFPLNYNTDESDYRVRQLGASQDFNFTFSIPFDFSTLVRLVLIGAPSAGAAGVGKDIDLESSYASIGEDINTHSESDVSSTYDTGTTNKFFELDLSSVFSSLTAGDECGVKVTHNAVGGSIDYFSIKLDYT